jgi:hypothetical protein
VHASLRPLVFSVIVVGACGGGGTASPTADASVTVFDAGPPPDASPTCIEAREHSDFAFIRDKIFARSCFFQTSCHNANPNAPAGLTLTQTRAYAEIVNVESTEVDLMRVAPGSCEESYLYAKITGNFDIIPANKKPMPPTFDGQGNWVPLCQEKVDAVCRWIERGAPEFEPDAGAIDAGPGADAAIADAGVPDATGQAIDAAPADAAIDAAPALR